MYQTCLIIRAALSGSVGSVGLAVILWSNQEVSQLCWLFKEKSVISYQGQTACVHISRIMESVNPNGDGTITFGFSELVIKFGSKTISTTSNESWAWLRFVKTVACHCSYGISAKNGDSCLHYYVPLKGLSVDISQFLYICPSNGFIKAGLSNHSLTGQHLKMGSLHSHKKISNIFIGLYTFCIRLTTASATWTVWLHLSGPSY